MFRGAWVGLFVLHFHLSLVFEPLVAQDSAKIRALAAQPEAFLQELEAAPLETYHAHVKRAKEAKAAGHKTHSYPEMKPVMDKILTYLDLRLQGQTAETLKQGFHVLRQEGENLLRQNIPYHDFMRWFFRFETALADETRSLRPELKGRFHYNLAGHMLERLLSRWPEALSVVAFSPITDSLFLKTRPTRMYLIGGTFEVVFGDGYELTQDEFPYHDLGHIEFMEFKESELRADGDFDDVASRQEFDSVRRSFDQLFRERKTENAPLVYAARILLFEIIHERGYHFDLRQLKAQLETEKWVDVVKLKLKTGFWNSEAVKKIDASWLSDARRWLLNHVYQLIEEKTQAALFADRSAQTEVEIKVQPEVRLAHGEARGIQLLAADGVHALIEQRLHGRILEVSLFDITLSQRPALQGSALENPVMLTTMERLLWAKAHEVRHWFWAGKKIEGQIECIRLNAHRPPRVLFNAASGEAHEIPPLELQPVEAIEGSPPRLDIITLYKMKQILQIEADQVQASFSLSDPRLRFRGRSKGLRSVGGVKVIDFEPLVEPPSTKTFRLRDVFVVNNDARTPDARLDDDEVQKRFHEWLQSIRYHDWDFHIGKTRGGDLYLQPQFVAYDSYTLKTSAQHGRKWFLSRHSTKNEVIQTALLAVLTSAEHQVRKNFFYKRARLYGPHFNIDQLRSTLIDAPAEAERLWTLSEVRDMVADMKFPNAKIVAGAMVKDGKDNGFYFQAEYQNPTVTPDEVNPRVEGPALSLPATTTETEIVQTVIQALILAAKLEAQRNFRVDGVSLYDPGEQCVPALLKLCGDDACLDRRRAE